MPKSAGPAKPTSEATTGPTWFERIFRPRWLVLGALIVAAPVLGPWVRTQLPDLKSRPEYRLPFAQLQLTPPPPSALPAEFLEQVRLRGNFEPELSLLDDELPRQLAEAFERHPWVDEVVSVRNVYPALVTVELTYRQPTALIEVPDGFYVVDRNGILLPPADFTADVAAKFIPVTGIRTAPQGAAGRAWVDPVVTGAAQLAEFLGVRWSQMGLKEIHVPTTEQLANPEDVLYELHTTGGSRIVWGRAPGSRHPGELTATQKLGRLDKYLAEFGTFERPQGPYEIDIRHWQEISRRPIENPFANTARGRETPPRR